LEENSPKNIIKPQETNLEIKTNKINYLSIIVPVYNEAGVIISTLDKLKDIIGNFKMKTEIIVVNDGSTDDTGKLLKNYSDIRLIDRHINRGYGFSLKEGIKEARGDWIIITDADGTYPLEVLPLLVEAADDVDMVIGERSNKANISILNRLAKVFLRILIYCLTYIWISDMNSGLRLFRKELVLKYKSIIPDGFSFTTTITVACMIENYKVKFIPISYSKRVGKSHIRPLRDFLAFIILILRIVTFFNPLRFFLPISIFFLFFAILKTVKDILVIHSIGSLAVILFIFSIQFFFFGLLADLIVTKFHKI